MVKPPKKDYDRWLRPGQVAEIFCVDPRTVLNWTNSGKLKFMTTPGGQRRYSEEHVYRVLRGIPEPEDGWVGEAKAGED